MATTDSHGTELWMTDGTGAGTQLLKDINPGVNSSNAFAMLSFGLNISSNSELYNGKMFIAADNGTNGTELWITDGTNAGTQMVKDISVGSGSGLPTENFYYYYTTAGLYFSANGGNGFEPYLSDGTSSGTNQVADVNPGAGSSDPRFLFVNNSQLFFNAHNGDNGSGNTDLYRLNGTVTPLPVSILQLSAAYTQEGVAVNWSTQSERNVRVYQVERSMNGVSFNTIGSVPATGSGKYVFVDRDMRNSTATVCYYRLRVEDADGSKAYTNVVKLNTTTGKPQFTIWPNPVKDILHINVSSVNATALLLQIEDGYGRQVYNKQLSVNGSSVERIDVSSLAQ